MWRPTSTLHLFKCCRMHQVQLPSFKCLTALRTFLGRTYRRGSLSVAAFGPGNAEAVAVGNRSGTVRSAGSRPMTLACREQYRSAISVERKWCCRTVLNCRPLLHRAYAFASAAFVLLILCLTSPADSLLKQTLTGASETVYHCVSPK